MKIFIIAMDDPLYINKFLKEIIDNKKKQVVGFALVENKGRMTLNKKQSKIVYLFSLLLIMGFIRFSINVFKTLKYNLLVYLGNRTDIIKSPSIIDYANSKGIETFKTINPNNNLFLDILKDKAPDVIINQSMSIIKNELLSVPSIGILNRHNALLPKNRGRLTPFWVIYKKEIETGVSIHFLDKKIDSGDIVIQKKYKVNKKDNFNTLVDKNYKIAPIAMIEALDKLENNDFELIENKDSDSTYNSLPTFKNAIIYRLRRIFYY